jgi:pSer/pThr/pTyr-binding forkhead associated (FHA) protein
MGAQKQEPIMQAVGFLEIQIMHAADPPIKIVAPGAEGYVIGRSDSHSSYVPDVDLAPFDALERGVSRRHAALVRYRGVVHVIDLSSVNGTFLNGERLLPDVPYALKAGDQLSLANLSLSITQSEV